MSNPETFSLDPKERLVDDLRRVIGDAEDLLQVTAEQTGEKAVEMRGRVRDSLARARVQLVAAEEALKVRAKEAAKATDAYVHEHPWRAVGMAAGAGLVLGLLLGRR